MIRVGITFNPNKPLFYSGLNQTAVQIAELLQTLQYEMNLWCMFHDKQLKTTCKLNGTEVVGKIIDVKYEKLYEDLKSWSDNGLNSLNYKVIKRDELNTNTTQIVVDLMKKGDEVKFPHLFPGPTSNYKKIYNNVKIMWKNIKIVDL